MKNPGFKSLKEQLDASNVTKGSNLEKFILANQDVHMLRQDEANDNIGIEPWLRIHWRKHHPEGKYSSDNPTGGYPRVLKRLQALMIRYQDLPQGFESDVNNQNKDDSSIRSNELNNKENQGRAEKDGQ